MSDKAQNQALSCVNEMQQRPPRTPTLLPYDCYLGVAALTMTKLYFLNLLKAREGKLFKNGSSTLTSLKPHLPINLLRDVIPRREIIAHFRVALSLSIKARPGAQPFI